MKSLKIVIVVEATNAPNKGNQQVKCYKCAFVNVMSILKDELPRHHEAGLCC